MNKSNYQIHYLPRSGLCGHSVTVEVSEEFIEFARKQKIDKRRYGKLGLEIVRACGWKNVKKGDTFGAPSICGWEGDSGLLRYINVPGNAAGIALEDTIIHGWVYQPMNMDTMSQAAAVLGIMTHYLMDIEIRIPRKTETENKSQQT